jgi:hypothetical protein
MKCVGGAPGRIRHDSASGPASAVSKPMDSIKPAG